jgi:hypothetical protein
LSNDDISGIFKVFQDTSSQQAQTERVIAIQLTGSFDLSMCAFDFLFMEELDRVRWAAWRSVRLHDSRA